jgi:NAD/NADP transhydrogenase beta subunit
MSMNIVTFAVMVASFCFIKLRACRIHLAARKTCSMVERYITIFTGALSWNSVAKSFGMNYVVGALISGAAGHLDGQARQMTKMPELVAFMRSMIGQQQCLRAA